QNATLLLQMEAHQISEELETIQKWPGTVTIAAYGTDQERETIRQEVEEADRPITLHYMYKTEKTTPYPIEHMQKLSVDTARTSTVLLVDAQGIIDYSQ
ncbi:hypothetical protein PMAYCL1PPCAC_16405, partial [Pristionchus mayeri]